MSARPCVSRVDLGGDVEILRLDAHDRDDRAGHGDQPPVIGGNSAISRAPAIVSRWSTCSWLMATRMTSGCLQRIRIFFAAPLQPVQQIATVTTLSRKRDLLLGLADAFAHPGEIDELGHRHSSMMCLTPARK